MLDLDSYLKDHDGKVMTTSDSIEGRYIDTPMNENELKKYEEIKPLLQKLIDLQDEVNEKALKLYKNKSTFNIICVMEEPFRTD